MRRAIKTTYLEEFNELDIEIVCMFSVKIGKNEVFELNYKKHPVEIQGAFLCHSSSKLGSGSGSSVGISIPDIIEI